MKIVKAILTYHKIFLVQNNGSPLHSLVVHPSFLVFLINDPSFLHDIMYLDFFFYDRKILCPMTKFCRIGDFILSLISRYDTPCQTNKD